MGELMQNVPWGISGRFITSSLIYFAVSICIHFIFDTTIAGPFVLLSAVALPPVVFLSYLHVSPQDKAVLITGCDSGFGHALARYLHRLGFIVFAGCLFADKDGEGAKALRAKGESTDRLHVVQLDITSDVQVNRAVEVVKGILPPTALGLWAVVNNAGMSTFGEVEWVSMAMFERIATINLFGSIRVAKAFLPLVRKAQGRTVNVASMMGRMGIAGRSPYCVTKWGMEGFSDCLRREMKRFGVKVIVIEPGNFIAGTALYSGDMMKKLANAMWEEMPEETQRAYTKEYYDTHVERMESYTTGGVVSITPVVTSMADAVTRAFPMSRYQPMSTMERIRVYTASFFPDWVFDNIFA